MPLTGLVRMIYSPPPSFVKHGFSTDSACNGSVESICGELNPWNSQNVVPRSMTAMPGNEEGDAVFIRRNRYRWSSHGFLDLDKVLWDQ